MTTLGHADLEALSAYVDGEAPEWADHVAGCAACRASVAELRAVAAAVGRPVEAPAVDRREEAIAAALGAAPVVAHEVQRERFARRRAGRPWALPAWAMPAIAAVLLAVVGLSGFLLANTRTSDNQTAGPALESGKATAGVSAAAPNAPVGNLGDIPDAATLLARAAPALPAAASARSSTNSGFAADAGAPPTTAAAPPLAVGAPQAGVVSGAAASAAAPNAVGTRPCEEQARAREPALGPVVYFATARKGQVDAYVLGFAPVGRSTPVTLLLLAQDGCRELLRAAGP